MPTVARAKKSPAARPRQAVQNTPASAKPAVAIGPAAAPETANCPCGGGCPRCTPPLPPGDTDPSVRQVLQHAGQPLDSFVQQQWESRFGAEFSAVRIHTGPAATSAAASLEASAFTLGHDIVFGENRYAPQTSAGQHLLAHELAHVVQQSHGPATSAPTALTTPGDAVETAAENAASIAVAGGRLRASDLVPTGPRLARSAQKGCDSSTNEGRPLIWFDRSAPTRSWRPATGYAQKRLNEQILIIENAALDPAKWQTIPEANRNFILDELDKLKYPLDVDCKFGEQTERATKIAQAYYFKDQKMWDGKIGPETWRAIDQPKPAAPPSVIPIPNVPVPPAPGPITL